MNDAKPTVVCLLSFAFAVALLAAGCSNPGDDDDASPTPSSCPTIWEQATTPRTGATSVVENGALALMSPDLGIAPDHIGVSWKTIDSLSGDFDVTVEFTSYVSGGTGSFFQAVVADDAAPGFYASGGIGNVSAAQGTNPAFSATVVPNVAYDEATHADVQARSDTETAGSITLNKTGSLMTVTTTVGSTSATKSDNSFSGTDFTLALQIGNNNPTATVDAPTSVEVTEVTGSLIDTFDCDSLSP